MIGISTAVKDEMLQASFADRVFSVGLFSGDDEIQDRIYQRRDVMFSSPVGEGTRYVQNNDVILFEGFNNAHNVDGWAVFDATGEVRAKYRLVKPLDVSSDIDAKFRPGELRIGLP